MARPSKPTKVITMEKKSHRTKKELADRKAREAGTLSGTPMKESADTKNDPVAHKTYRSLKKMFKAIEKDDALYSQTVNRYCMITAEVEKLQADRSRTEKMIEDSKDGCEPKEFIEMMKLLMSIDRELKSKRQQLFAIEKENCMTIASALRSIPKKPEQNTSELKRALYGS